ncbi:uncharacterized protein BDV17DRAFT_293684 [Aspergillus undulatus]|uniref:uncharacterized protein n=1 Tax=Aspergillus undulatus TaxID=1810928 RepID=UPI003CCE1AC9
MTSIMIYHYLQSTSMQINRPMILCSVDSNLSLLALQVWLNLKELDDINEAIKERKLAEFPASDNDSELYTDWLLDQPPS